MTVDVWPTKMLQRITIALSAPAGTVPLMVFAERVKARERLGPITPMNRERMFLQKPIARHAGDTAAGLTTTSEAC